MLKLIIPLCLVIILMIMGGGEKEKRVDEEREFAIKELISPVITDSGEIK